MIDECSDGIYRRSFMGLGRGATARRYTAGVTYAPKRGGNAKPRVFISFNCRDDDACVVYRVGAQLSSCTPESWHRWAGEEVPPVTYYQLPDCEDER